jgi:UDP-2-acetamido-3-amino-2,3-dideoxy-glucuronate N-acetyltransferase
MVFTNVLTPRSHVSRRGEFQRTLVKRGATIGANATVLCGTTLGEYALVGAGAVVTADVPAYALMVGVPARRVGWACACGVPLAGKGPEFTCTDCGATYRSAGETLIAVTVGRR